MKVLNLYYTSTGNTEKVACTIQRTVENLGYKIDKVKVNSKRANLDILQYKFVFVGSGVYQQLPGKPLMELYGHLLKKYARNGEIKPAAPRRHPAQAVVYCTYGGTHTGINEAIPSVKYMGQLFDHLGYTIVGEWYVVGEYKPEKMQGYSLGGRLGDIRGRPNGEDLREIAERVKGVFKG